MLNINELKYYPIEDIVDDIEYIKTVEDDISDQFMLKGYQPIYKDEKIERIERDGYVYIKLEAGDRYVQEYEYKDNGGPIVRGKFITTQLTNEGSFILMKYQGDLCKDSLLSHGYGKIISYSLNLRYEGQFKEDNMTGYGILMNSGMRYEGELVNGVIHGRGRIIMKDYKINGLWNSGFPYGIVKVIYADGTKYEGPFEKYEATGKGRLIFMNNDRYEGDILNREPHGYGRRILSNGEIYEGNFVNGLPNGDGVVIDVNAKPSKGNFIDDLIEDKSNIFSKLKKVSSIFKK